MFGVGLEHQVIGMLDKAVYQGRVYKVAYCVPSIVSIGNISLSATFK